MSNPNNCASCEHKIRHYEHGHCYMFRLAPTEPCAQHTCRYEASKSSRLLVLAMTMKMKYKENT